MTGDPGLEMLWERADPEAVLRERFGFADGAAVAGWVGRVLRAEYHVSLRACRRVVMSADNALAWTDTDAGALIVKWCVDPSRFGRLSALAELTAWLDGCGVPVSAPLRPVGGARQIEADGVSLGVQRVIAGELLDCSDVASVRRAGATLARLHAALAEAPEELRPFAGATAPTPSPRALITGWLEDAPQHLPAEAVESLRLLVAAAPDIGDLPAQLVHGDFRAANMLCRDGDVVAVLDFEEARRDHAIVEVARSVVLLGTRFHDWGPVTRHTREVFRAGYESVRPFGAIEAAWWEPLVLWGLLLFVPAGEDPTGWRAAALDQARGAQASA